MATDGIEGVLVGTRNYGATAAFWKSPGFENVPETGLEAPLTDGDDDTLEHSHG